MNFKKKAQLAFFIGLLIVILIFLPFSLSTYVTVQDFIANKPEGYRWPELTDLWFTGITTFVFWSLQKAFGVALYPLFYRNCKEKEDDDIRKMRTKKAVANAYKLFYYTMASFLGWYTLKDSYILPAGLGGSGALENQFINFPYIQQPTLYRYYFTGTMGYHMGSLIHHFFAPKQQNDYIEMMFHHFITIYLYTFSYMSNCLIGAVVSLIHDITDIFVSWTRMWAETEYKKTTAYSFVFAQFVWVYCRLYWLFQCIYVSTVKLEVFTASPYVQPIFGILLSGLLLLHIYWLVLMLGILFTYFTKGVADDTVNNIDKSLKAKSGSEEEGTSQKVEQQILIKKEAKPNQRKNYKLE